MKDPRVTGRYRHSLFDIIVRVESYIVFDAGAPGFPLFVIRRGISLQRELIAEKGRSTVF